jgi:hypothetical protein
MQVIYVLSLESFIVSETVINSSGDNPFSIQGKFRDGRPSYLDMSATTPLDPRMLDKMIPYFVSDNTTCHIYILCIKT